MRNLKIVLIAGISTLLTLIFILLFLISRQENGIQQNTHIPIEIICSFKALNKKLVLQGGRKLLVLFSPGCEICEEEFQMIETNYSKISDTQIILISPFKIEQVSDFLLKYPFCQSGNVTVLIGDNALLTRIFGNFSFPTMFILDENSKVLRRFRN